MPRDRRRARQACGFEGAEGSLRQALSLLVRAEKTSTSSRPTYSALRGSDGQQHGAYCAVFGRSLFLNMEIESAVVEEGDRNVIGRWQEVGGRWKKVVGTCCRPSTTSRLLSKRHAKHAATAELACECLVQKQAIVMFVVRDSPCLEASGEDLSSFLRTVVIIISFSPL